MTSPIRKSVEAAAEKTGLVRALGRWDLTAVGVNQVIGSGIFVLPASVAALVGEASSVWPFLLAGLVNTLIVLCFAEVGTHFRTAGGPYVYAREAFGGLAGFEVAWMMWLTRLASLAALANAVPRYLSYFWAPAGHRERAPAGCDRDDRAIRHDQPTRRALRLLDDQPVHGVEVGSPVGVHRRGHVLHRPGALWRDELCHRPRHG